MIVALNKKPLNLKSSESDIFQEKTLKKEVETQLADDKEQLGLLRTLKFVVRKGNKTIIESYR